MEKLSKIFKDLKQRLTRYGSKKLIEKTAIIAIIGVICLIAGSVLFEGGLNKNSKNTPEIKGSSDSVETIKQAANEPKKEMETSLEAILSKIKGAGKVDVMITFYSGNESVPAFDVKASEDNTQEKDKEGGTRTVKQTDKENKIIYEESNGVKKPYVVKELLPQVKGVVIVADGAADAEIKSNLARATEALLEVASHKIQVFERNSN